MATVKTWRALKTQNVEGQVRHYGDFVPEAAKWPNLPVWLRSGHVEETFIDSDELEEALKAKKGKSNG
jgi:predicted oxidoreductase (fatty acid repression mutant protein)